MARAIYEYTKTVLKKVSFDAELFFKELEKALNRLLPFEIEELRIWLEKFTADKPELTPSLIALNKKKELF
jgi:DNA replication protein DnaD